MSHGQILAATPPYTPATVYGHQVPQSAGAAIAFVFIALIALLLIKMITGGKAKTA